MSCQNCQPPPLFDLTEIQQPTLSPHLSQETCSFSLSFPILMQEGKNYFFSLAATFAFTPISAFSSLKKRPSCFSDSSASQAPGLQDHGLDESAARLENLFAGLLRLAQVPSDTYLSPYILDIPQEACTRQKVR